MFDDKYTLINNLGTPMNIASMALTEFENRLDGDKVIASANSPFCFLLEYGATINAASITAMEEKLPTLYPARAVTMKDLFAHMSDYEYLRMYNTPAMTMLRMTLPKKYLKEYAVAFNDNYKQVTLPKDTVFRVGTLVFGMYYPINILINNFMDSYTVVYDTTNDNPLQVLTKNVVDKYDTTISGLDYLIIDFPIYQFAKTIKEDSLVAETGFTKSYVYNNKFYALRIFHLKNGEYHEMGQSQSEVIYDPINPTALIKVMPDTQTVNITIPQIYFDNGIMGSKIYVEVYTTLGALDIATVNISPTSLQANFAQKNKDTTIYSSIFKNLPFDLIMQLSSDKIVGGSNAIDVTTLRERVVSDTLYEKAPITDAEIAVYLEDNGFYVKKYIDNVTDRIYHAYRVLEDGGGSILPSITLNMRMLVSYVDSRPTFQLQSDNSITILPNTIYRYVEDTDDVIPLTVDEFTTLADADKPTMVNILNNNKYFKSPFHMRVTTDDYFPETESFNLMTPEILKIIFDDENYNVSAKMNVMDARISHLEDGVGGYQLDFSVYKSDDLKEVASSDITMYAVVKTSAGYTIGKVCEFVSNIGERDIYTTKIETNYRLTQNEEIAITNFEYNDGSSFAEQIIPMISDFHIVFLVNKSAIIGSYQDASSSLTSGVPSQHTLNKVALSRQHVTVKLGHSLKDVISNNTEVASTPAVYEVWDVDIQDVYTEDVYERDASGTLIYTMQGDTPVLHKLHNVGDLKYDESGVPVLKYKKGDIKRDSSGMPIIATDRNKIYFIETMLLDAKIFASERTSELDFIQQIHGTMEGYFDIVRNLQSQLLERTHVYFKCVRSTGSAKFNIGDGVVVTRDIEMTFSIVVYVPSYVKNDETIQNTIKDKMYTAIESAIKTKTISMLDIFEQVKSKMSDYIEHITLLGTNGIVADQTFVIVSEDAQPSIARKLELSEDNIISLVKQVEIEFVALEDNQTGIMSAEV